MVTRTVTTEDIDSLCLKALNSNRCVDMASTFGDDYCKMEAIVHESTRDESAYLFFYNLSLNLPINLNVAPVIGITPSHLKIKKRLFWRGDVVVMKARLLSEQLVESLDADLSELESLEQFFRTAYQEGDLERRLDYKELHCEEESMQMF